MALSRSSHDAPPLDSETAAILARFDLSLDEPTRREYYRHGWWRTSTLADDFAEACRRSPDKTALATYRDDHSAPHRLTYGELGLYVERIAGALVHLGIRRGDVVSAQLPNWWQFPAVALATVRVGAIFNPVIPIHRQREVSFIADLVEPAVFFYPRVFRRFDHGAMFSDLAGSLPKLRHRVVVDDAAIGDELSLADDILAQPWEDRERDELARRRARSDALSDIQFTSGTTGEPKGVGHTHNTLLCRARALDEAVPLDESDVVFMPSTLAHSTGFVYGCMLPLSRGMTAVYQDVWAPQKALDIISAERATWMFGSSAFIIDLVRAHRDRSVDISSLTRLISGGAPIPSALVDDVRRRLGGQAYAVWGMTENGAVTVTRHNDGPDAASMSDGHPCQWMQLKIIDPVTRDPVARGSEGLLLVRGASQMIGYVRRPKLTLTAVDNEGWFDTGDLARLQPDGSLRITGRVKDIVIRGGENIPSTEVENALYSHPGIAEVAVVPVPDERLGERACAVVVLESGYALTLDDLREHLDRVGVPRTYWPERLEFRSQLPRTFSGKVQKFRLKEEVARVSRPE